MATPVLGKAVIHTCCEVWQHTEDSLEPCWVCGDTGTSVKLTDLPDFHPWTKIQYLSHSQTATRPYL